MRLSALSFMTMLAALAPTHDTPPEPPPVRMFELPKSRPKGITLFRGQPSKAPRAVRRATFFETRRTMGSEVRHVRWRDLPLHAV